MRLTLADIQFAEQAAFDKAWPTLKKKYELANQRRPLFNKSGHERIHAAINSHVGLKRKKYQWATTLYIIAARIKRGEAWIGYQHWFAGSPSSADHITIMGRVARKYRKSQERKG